MSTQSGQSRPALGQNADLGSLYNARDDSFIPLDLVGSNLSPQAITTTKIGSAQVTVIANDTLQEKFTKLGVSNQLAASFLAGMIPVSGSGYYLKSTRRSEKYIEGAVLLDIATEEVKLDLNSLQRTDHTSLTGYQDVTHVVAGVTFGARIIFGARLAVEEGSSQSEKQLESQLEKFAAYVRSKQTPIVKSEEEQSSEQGEPLRDQLGNLRLAIFSDLNDWQRVDNVGIHDSISFIDSFFDGLPSKLATMDHGRGVNISYTLVPIGSLHNLPNFRTGKTIPVAHIPDGILREFVRVFGQCNQHERLIHDYHNDSEAVYFRCPNARNTEAAHVGSQLESILQEILALKSNYRRALSDVRNLTCPPIRLTEILHQYHTGKASPKSVQLVLSRAVDDIRLKMAVLDNGGQYGNYTDATNAISTGSNIYVFWFTRESKQDNDSWKANRRIVLNLLQRKSDYVVVAAECMPEDINFSKPRVSFYSRGEVVIKDMRESQDYADQSFAKYEPKALNSDGRPSPIGRQPVKIECPLKCGDEEEWYCYKCRQPLEYCNRRFYCDCGHTCAKSFTWQCKSPKHGTQFVAYKPRRLMKRLQQLESYKEQNILLLGETGVGKSTFINAFYNYITYRDLDDAMSREKLEAIIPSSFTMQRIEESSAGRRFIQTDIHVGKNDKFEADGTRGDSATQQTGVYRIPIGDTIYRIIDTPGVGDVRGVEADRQNLDNILQTLSRINSLNGILILLKPNASRLTLTFRFCIQELLTYLHRDAASNIMWGFTNTRQSNYMPGDSYKPLERLLEQHKALGLTLTPDNVFCFDSESFRCLAAQKQGCVPTENLEDFRRSWKRSADETHRLLKSVSSLQPHSITSTLCLNRARELISQLTKPIAEVDDKIQRTIEIAKHQLDQVNKAKTRKDVLEQSLYYQRVDIDIQRLDRPRTVCKNPACVDLKDVGGVKRPLYKSLCHDPCYLTHVTEEVVGHADLINCAAFDRTSRCSMGTCGHHWQEHMHIRFSQEEKTVKVRDPVVQLRLSRSTTTIEAQQTAMQELEKQVEGHRRELEEIRNAASQFGVFLKGNSITPYNDAMIAYLDELIKEERNLIGFSASQGVALPANEKRLEGLEKSKSEYKVRIGLLEDQMANSDGVTLLDEQGVDDMVNKLYSLPLWGRRLQELREVVEWSKAENFREQQFRPKVNKDVIESLQHQPKTVVGYIGSTVTSALSNGYSAVKNLFSHQAPGSSSQDATNRGKKRALPQDPNEVRPEGYITRAKRRRQLFTASQSQS